MKKVYQAIIFDADGTLVNTTELIVKGYMQTLSENGYHEHATEERIKSCVGGTVPHCLAKMLELEPDLPEIERLAKYHDQVQDSRPEWITAYPSASSTLNKLKANGLKIGLFTSASVYQVQRNFRAVDIYADNMFDCLVTADDRMPPKPSPAGLLLALEKLGGINPFNCVYVGDHDVDMQAGKEARAGLTVGVSHGFHDKEKLINCGADIVINKLDQLLPFVFSE